MSESFDLQDYDASFQHVSAVLVEVGVVELTRDIMSIGFYVKQLRADLAAAQKRIAELEGNNTSISKWLSAALEDSKVCKEMKEDINNWFNAF